MALLLLAQGADAEQHGVFLLYHHVSADTPAVTSTHPEEFAAHLNWLEENDFKVWPASRLAQQLAHGEVPAKTVAITFDDAYRSIYTTAFPLLKARGWPFTLFVSTIYVGLGGNYLSWSELREMQAHGAEFGNHTHSHPHLLRIPEGQGTADTFANRKAEIETATTILTRELGQQPRLFAYPYGEYDSVLADLIAQLGYTGFGQHSGAAGSGSDFRLLPRYTMSGTYAGIEDFALKVQTRRLPTITAPVDPTLSNTTVRPTLVLTFAKPPGNLDALACFGPGGLMDLAREGNRVRISPTADLPAGRSRYNCTLPGADGHYLWHSQLWIKRQGNGDWAPE